jgi:hypothetical protein
MAHEDRGDSRELREIGTTDPGRLVRPLTRTTARAAALPSIERRDMSKYLI